MGGVGPRGGDQPQWGMGWGGIRSWHGGMDMPRQDRGAARFAGVQALGLEKGDMATDAVQMQGWGAMQAHPVSAHPGREIASRPRQAHIPVPVDPPFSILHTKQTGGHHAQGVCGAHPGPAPDPARRVSAPFWGPVVRTVGLGCCAHIPGWEALDGHTGPPMQRRRICACASALISPSLVPWAARHGEPNALPSEPLPKTPSQQPPGTSRCSS